MRIKVTIGDWSEDGHGEYDILVYEVNKDVSEIRQAYKDSCKKTGYQFNINEDFTGLDLPWPAKERIQICTDYQENLISEDAAKELSRHGIEIDTLDYQDPEGFANLIMEFIKLSLPDLTWEEASFFNSELKKITPLNGWWNKELNTQFGYGLYS